MFFEKVKLIIKFNFDVKEEKNLVELKIDLREELIIKKEDSINIKLCYV